MVVACERIETNTTITASGYDEVRRAECAHHHPRSRMGVAEAFGCAEVRAPRLRHAPESIEPTMRKMDQLTPQIKCKRHSDLISPRVSSARQQRQVAVEVCRCCLHPPPWHRARGRAAGTCQINRWRFWCVCPYSCVRKTHTGQCAGRSSDQSKNVMSHGVIK